MPVISAPPTYSPSRGDDVEGGRRAEVHAHRRTAEALADRDRVDEPVGADLAGVVVADRHPRLGSRADGEHLVAEIAARHRRPLGLELGHGRGDDRGVEVGEAVAAQLEQVAQRGAELVGGGLAHGRKAPVLEQLLARERPEVGLRVSDVDGEQHRRPLCSAATMAANEPKLYVLPGSHPCAAVEVALQLKAIAYKRVDLLPTGEMLFGPLLYGGRTVPGMRIDGERLVGSRPIMRRLDELAPEPPLLPAPGDPAYARVLEAERWGDEVFQSVPRRVIDVAVPAPSGGDGELRGRRASCRSRARCCGRRCR